MIADFALYLDLQKIVSSDSIPKQEKIESWVRQTLFFVDKEEEKEDAEPDKADTEYELTIRIVDKEEIQSMNRTYRHKDKSTNVLSFPFEAPIEIQLPLLGDIIICHDIVVEEAKQQQKTIEAHWAHMIIHGVLHLKGYDHLEDTEAQLMESLEIKILKDFNFSDPYQ